MRELTSGLRRWAVLGVTILAPASVSGQALEVSFPEAVPLASLITVGDITGPGYPGGGGPTSQNLPIYQAPGGTRYDGVARLFIGGSGCTGSLISNKFILTAAHCVKNPAGVVASAGSITAGFLNSTGGIDNYSASAVYVKAGYTGTLVVDSNDVALIRLSTGVSRSIPRYSLFHNNPMHQKMQFVGYGRTGNGLTGGVQTNQFDAVPTRRVAHNSFESNMTQGGASFTVNLAGTPVNPILVSDFDGAQPETFIPNRGFIAAQTAAQNNTLCNVWTPAAGVLGPALMTAICSPGYGQMEGEIGAGDSGGPAFVQSASGRLRIAAVASFGSQRCVPSPTFSTSPGCPAGSVLNGAYFGSYNGHVAVGVGSNNAFIMETTATPEPVSMVLIGTGLAGIAGAHRRRKAARSAAPTA